MKSINNPLLFLAPNFCDKFAQVRRINPLQNIVLRYVHKTEEMSKKIIVNFF